VNSYSVNNVWEFDTDGALTLPNGGHIGPSGGKGQGTTYGAANDHLVSLTSYYNSGLYSSCVTAYADGTLNITAYNDGGPNPAKIWTFDNTGTLTLPDDSGIKSSTNIDITIDTPDSSTFNWRFGADGGLTLPSTGKISNSGYDWTFGTDGSLTLPTAGKIANGVDIAPAGSALTIATNGNGGLDSAYNSNTLVVAYNAAILSTFAVGSTITFQDGVVATITEFADYGPTSIDIGWNPPKSGTLFPIILKTANYVAPYTAPEWTLGTDGDLTLPAGGDIVNSTGVSQTAQRVEGSWSAATGTNTYSFTVPMDGTYTMWVKCNIPNGIIVWNATVSVSNSNVPAIGTQYAWNYTGGGNPILLTAIPDQIRGTAGGISTDATYVGTTSNRFDFTIANTSGSAQTVYYGYTKV
jgi:hypothetical protein